MRIQGEYFPLASNANALLRGLEVNFDVALGVPKDVTNTADPISLGWRELELGVGWQWGMGSGATIGGDVAVGQMDFSFKDPGVLADEVPDVTYNYYRLAAKAGYHVNEIHGDVSMGYLGVLSAGTMADRFDDASSSGIFARAAVSYDLSRFVTEGMSAQASTWIRRFGHDFKSAAGDMVEADGGTDLFFGFLLGAAYSY